MSQDERREEERAEGRRKRKKSGRGFGDYKFVDINLSEEEKDIFRSEHAEPDESIVEMMSDWVGSGYKLSVSSDARGGGVLVTLTSRFGALSNEGYILTARAGDVTKALYVLWYKDVYVCDSSAWAETAEKRSGLSGDIG